MTMVNSISCMSSGKAFAVGDEVESADVRFFIGAINDSHGLCAIDKSKPWTVKTTTNPMRKCMEQGNYSVNFHQLEAVKGTP